MRLRSRLGAPLAILLVLIAATAAPAQTPTDPDDDAKTAEKRTEAEKQLELKRLTPLVAQPGPIDPDKYLLGPGDVLEIDLWGPLTRNIPLVVSPEGTILIPGRGPVPVAGKTLGWMRNRLLEVVAATYRGVHAEVRLVQLRTFKVFMIGAVKNSGPMEVSSVTRASEAVTLAEPQPGASRRNIEVRRRDGSTQRLDLDRFNATGSERFDPTLVDGDVVVVGRTREVIGVAGGVSQPGSFEYAVGDSLSTLLTLSGGPLPSATPERALLVRFDSAAQRESVWVNLLEIQGGKGDLALRDGDQLFVGTQSRYHDLPAVAIVGEVEHPGSYPIEVGRDRFTDLVRWAGGFRPYANQGAVVLVREPAATENDPEFDRLARLSRSEMTESEYAKFQTRLAERKNSFRLDWSRIQKGGTDVDPLLVGGDVVRVDQLVPSVRIEGQVRRPGLVDYLPGRKLTEYVDLAGGFTDRAARSNISVSRTLTGQVVPASSVTGLQPGDFIWIPERRDVDAWAVFRDVVTVATQVAVLIYTLSR